MRKSLLAEAHGRVLEIGGGTGANLPHYNGIDSLVITEPEPPMLRRLERKAREHEPLAKVLRAPAEDLPFEDATFDTVVSTLVLCGVDDQPRALRDSTHNVAVRMNWLNRFVVHCDCNRPTLATIETEGFTIDRLERTTLPKAPKFVRPAIIGTAKARA